MRILTALMASRLPQREPVPFQEILPLKLKQKVSGKGNRESDVCCIYEMSLMFSCLKESEFSQQPCSKEIDAFQKCYKDFATSKKQKRDKEAKGLLSPGEKHMSPKQINILLKRFPNLE